MRALTPTQICSRRRSRLAPEGVVVARPAPARHRTVPSPPKTSDSGARDLSRAMAELARSLSGPRSLDERLRAVTDEVVELMPPKTCAGILLVSGKRFETVAPTPPHY
ncbi:hypothetical protein HJ581_0004700 [Rhodococcus opacus]|nr:hypothetical protein HJ581_0004700 [Rhodococcus opacus]